MPDQLELRQAITEVKEAQEYFDMVEGKEQIDEAIYGLKEKELRLNRIIRDIKKVRGLKTIEH